MPPASAFANPAQRCIPEAKYQWRSSIKSQGGKHTCHVSDLSKCDHSSLFLRKFNFGLWPSFGAADFITCIAGNKLPLRAVTSNPMTRTSAGYLALHRRRQPTFPGTDAEPDTQVTGVTDARPPKCHSLIKLLNSRIHTTRRSFHIGGGLSGPPSCLGRPFGGHFNRVSQLRLAYVLGITGRLKLGRLTTPFLLTCALMFPDQGIITVIRVSGAGQSRKSSGGGQLTSAAGGRPHSLRAGRRNRASMIPSDMFDKHQLGIGFGYPEELVSRHARQVLGDSGLHPEGWGTNRSLRRKYVLC